MIDRTGSSLSGYHHRPCGICGQPADCLVPSHPEARCRPCACAFWLSLIQAGSVLDPWDTELVSLPDGRLVPRHEARRVAIRVAGPCPPEGVLPLPLVPVRAICAQCGLPFDRWHRRQHHYCRGCWSTRMSRAVRAARGHNAHFPAPSAPDPVPSSPPPTA